VQRRAFSHGLQPCMVGAFAVEFVTDDGASG
jgi:hypothetical protein